MSIHSLCFYGELRGKNPFIIAKYPHLFHLIDQFATKVGYQLLQSRQEHNWMSVDRPLCVPNVIVSNSCPCRPKLLTILLAPPGLAPRYMVKS